MLFFFHKGGIIKVQINNDFQKLVIEIHRVNQGWHCFEASNRFLNIQNKNLELYYLQQKNLLQDRLMKDFSQMIKILPKDDTGFSRIFIREEYQFQNYKDVCHIKGNK